MTRPRAPLLLSLLAASLAGGCGNFEGPERYSISGTVSYNGAPIPVGEISFEPDVSQGNDGPGSTALIKDGKFQTSSDGGVVGGPYIVWISGFDGKAYPGGDSPEGLPLFNARYKTVVTLPKEASTQDFHMPAK